MLAALRQTWAPRAFVVSFKLETDENIVLQKVGCLCVQLRSSPPCRISASSLPRLRPVLLVKQQRPKLIAMQACGLTARRCTWAHSVESTSLILGCISSRQSTAACPHAQRLCTLSQAEGAVETLWRACRGGQPVWRRGRTGCGSFGKAGTILSSPGDGQLR